MNYMFFIGEGAEVEGLIAECQKIMKTRNEKIIALRQKYNADYILELRGTPTQLGFKTVPSDWKKWLANKEEYTENEETVYVFTPRMNTNRGKELYADMTAKEMCFDPSKFLIDRIGATYSAIEGNVIVNSVAGFNGNILFVKIPVGRPFYDTKKQPQNLPSWLREVTFTEWNTTWSNQTKQEK